MKHALILAHPDRKSFNAAVAKAYAAAVRGLGHEVESRDLYAMGFDPCLRKGELPWAPGHAPGPDVVAERQALASCDVFVFVYPLWFNAPPAILKGYVDRVFGSGFGFASVSGRSDPLLVGRRLLSFSTSGAPEEWVRDSGAMQALSLIFDKHISAMTGVRVVDHVHFGGVVPNMSREAGQACLDDVARAVTRAFGAAPNA